MNEDRQEPYYQEDNQQGEENLSGYQNIVETGGGSYVSGPVNTGGGDFVGRDKITFVTEETAYDVRGLPNPYPGLRSFTYDDRESFAGRETLILQAVDKLTNPEGPINLLFITGASGSGKSSFAQAGLLPGLEAYYARRHKFVSDAVFRPSSAPLIMLGDAFDQLGFQPLETSDLAGLFPEEFTKYLEGNKSASQVSVLVIDQFEELFTQSDAEQARRVIGWLSGLPEFERTHLHVIATLRSDYLDELFFHSELWQAAKQGIDLRSMGPEELKLAIQKPLHTAGERDERYREKRIEPALVDRLAQDASQDPAYLPLLQVTLQELWNAGELVLERYGQLSDAIRKKAESVYAFEDYDLAYPKKPRSEEDRAQLISILLDLVNVSLDDDARRDVRRRRPKSELAGDSIQRSQLIDNLIAARLLSVSLESLHTDPVEVVDIIHESLIINWMRLQQAIVGERQNLQRRVRFEQALQEWLGNEKDSRYLLTGVRLAEGRELEQRGDITLRDPAAQEFLHASRVQDEHDMREREAQRQRELEASRELAEAQQHSAKLLRRRAVILLGVLVFALIAALTAGMFASRNSTLAMQNASIAQTAQAVSKQAVADFTRSEAQRLAAEAKSLMESASDPQLISLLSLRSINTQYTPEGDTALTGAAALPIPKIIFTGHDRGVYSVSFSPDGKFVVTGSYDGIVRLFEAQTGQEIRQFEANDSERGVKAIFSPEGETIYAASNDNTVWSWDVKTGEVGFHLNNDDGPIDIEVSPDGKRLLIGSAAGTPRLLDAQTGATICQFTGHTDAVWELAFSPDARYVATSSLDTTARLWKAENCELVRVFSGHTDDVASVDFSPDGKYLATGSWDKTARLWDVETGEELRQFIGHTCYLVRSVRFSPDGKYLLTGNCDKTARLWDVQTGMELYTFNGHTEEIWTVAFSGDGRYILTGSRDKTAWLWDLQNVSGEHPRFLGHTDSIWSVALSPDGKLLATGGSRKNTRLWDAHTGQELHTFDTSDVSSVAFSPDGRYLLAGAGDSKVSVWDVQTKELVQSFIHDPVENAMVMGIAFSPDGKYALTSGQDAFARRWDIQTGELLTTYGAGTDNIGGPDTLYGVAYSPDRQYVLTGGWDGVMRLYDVQSGQELRQFTDDDIGSIYGVAFSPDSRLALSASKDKTARVWDVQTGQELQRLIGHTAYLYAVAFSPDGKLALTSSADNTARLWDLQTGQELRRFIGHQGPVEWAAFSTDGKTFVTGSDDGTARMWSVDYRDTLNYLCTSLLRDFTDAERELYQIKDDLPTCPVK